MAFRSGMVAVVGRPNVGKSTLINHVVGRKVSIVSDKVQTTRRRVLGIATTDDWQIAFVDTPGIHKPKHRLGKALNETARSSAEATEAVLVVVDCSKPPGPEDKRVADMLEVQGWFTEEKKGSVILCMNKMDLLPARFVEHNFNAYQEMFPNGAWMMTSLVNGENADKLVDAIVSLMPEGPMLFPEDMYTDQSMRSIASELIREKALHLTREEVPHSVAVVIESWEEEEDLTSISALIIVETEGQKKIIIGRKGRLLGQIGSAARQELMALLGRKVYLETFVKVDPGWRESARRLQELDYFG